MDERGEGRGEGTGGGDGVEWSHCFLCVWRLKGDWGSDVSASMPREYASLPCYAATIFFNYYWQIWTVKPLYKLLKAYIISILKALKPPMPNPFPTHPLFFIWCNILLIGSHHSPQSTPPPLPHSNKSNSSKIYSFYNKNDQNSSKIDSF